MSTPIRDLRYATRSLRRRPGFAVLFVVILAMGVGTVASLSSVVDRVLLHPLGYAQEDRLFAIVATNPELGEFRAGQFAPDYWELAEQLPQALDGLALYGWRSLTLEEPGRVQQLRSVAVSGAFFQILGTEPLTGRLLAADDEVPGWGHVAVISERLWQNAFGRDPDIVGRVVPINGRSVTLVGVVASAAAVLPTEDPDLWMPVGRFDGYERSAFSREERDFSILARVSPGSNPTQATEAITTITTDLAQRFPATNDGWGMALVPVKDWLVGEAGAALEVSLAAVALLFLIALINLAALLTLRMVAQREELAVRRALGAADRELLRLVLAECLVLCVAGTGASLLVAGTITRLIEALAPGVIPRSEQIVLEPRVLVLSAIAAFLAVSTIGAIAAWTTLRQQIEVARGRGSGESVPAERLRRGLVVAEVALALTLLAAAGFIGHTLGDLSRVDPGFEIAGTYSAHILLDGGRYGPWPKRQEYFRTAVDRIRNIPGVEMAALTTTPPVPGLGIRIESAYRGADGPAVDEPRAPRAGMRIVGPGYLNTLKIPLLSGRDILATDDLNHPRVVLVNRELAERAWPGENPVGQQLEIFYEERLVAEVVGVVGDTFDEGLHLPPQPSFFLAYEQLPFMGSAVALRTSLPETSIEESVRQTILSIDPAQPLMRWDHLSAGLDDSLARERFFTLLLSVFALVAWVLAAAGIYGAFSHWVVRKRREIGLRLALGSTRGQILAWLSRFALLTIVPGLFAGLLGAGMLGAGISRAFDSMSGVEPLVLVAATAVLAASALLACLLPAVRVSNVSPAVALEGE